MSITGPGPDEPTRVGVPIADLLAGMYGAYGVVAALHERARTGRGTGRAHQPARVASSACTRSRAPRYTVAGEVPHATGNHHPAICPYGLFHCADGAVQISVGSDGLWRRFAPAFDLDRPEWATNPQRVARPRRRHRRGRRRIRAVRRQPICLRGWTNSASRPAWCATSPRSTSGTRPARRAC